MSATFLEHSAPAAASGQVGLRTPAYLRHASLLPVMCSLTGESIRSCQVTASVLLDGQTVTVGRGHVSLEGRPIAHKVAVGIDLTEVGRRLADRDGGVTLVLDAVVHGAGASSYVISEPHVVAVRH